MIEIHASCTFTLLIYLCTELNSVKYGFDDIVVHLCVYLFVSLYFSESMGQITVTQSPLASVHLGESITLTCKTSSGINSWGLYWYQQKDGEAPNLLVYHVNDLQSGIPSRFAGGGSQGGSDFSLTISGVQAEDAGDYSCMSVHKVSGVYVLTQ